MASLIAECGSTSNEKNETLHVDIGLSRDGDGAPTGGGPAWRDEQRDSSRGTARPRCEVCSRSNEPRPEHPTGHGTKPQQGIGACASKYEPHPFHGEEDKGEKGSESFAVGPADSLVEHWPTSENTSCPTETKQQPSNDLENDHWKE